CLCAVLRRHAQDRRGMDRHQNLRSPFAVEKFTAIDEHLELWSHQRAYRRAAKADDQARSEKPDFAQEPVKACGYLLLRRRLVHTPLAARLPTEMLHRV